MLKVSVTVLANQVLLNAIFFHGTSRAELGMMTMRGREARLLILDVSLGIDHLLLNKLLC
jgi:hypothetical protein